MQKKKYMTPNMEVMEIKTMTLLAGSGVNSDLGIDYGGIDEGGSLDPAAPPGLPSMGDLVGLPDFMFD